MAAFWKRGGISTSLKVDFKRRKVIITIEIDPLKLAAVKDNPKALASLHSRGVRMLEKVAPAFEAAESAVREVAAGTLSEKAALARVDAALGRK